MTECFYNHFWDTPPSFDASNDRGALSANDIKTAEVCFLSAAQDIMEEDIYLDYMVFETNLRLKNDLTYIILCKCTCKTYGNRLYKNLDANLYRGAKTWYRNTFSDEMAVYVLPALGDVVDCFLVLGVELELQFLNHISLFAKLLNSLAFRYINDHDLFMLFVFHYV